MGDRSERGCVGAGWHDSAMRLLAVTYGETDAQVN